MKSNILHLATQALTTENLPSRRFALQSAAMRGAAIAVAAAVLASMPAVASAQPWLGVIIHSSHDPPGATVEEVIKGTPADIAGLEVGDVITRISDVPVADSVSLITTVSQLQVGADVEVEIVRDRRARKLRTRLEAKVSDSEILARRLVGTRLPDFTLPRLSGGYERTADHRGEVLVVYFVGVGCPGCGALTQRIDQLQGVRGRDGVTVLGIVGSGAGDRARKAYRIGFPLLHDVGDQVRDSLRANGSPIAVVAGRDGVIRYAAMNDEIRIDELRLAVNRAVREPSRL